MFKNIFEGKQAAIFNLNGVIASNTEVFKKAAIYAVLKEIGYGYINPDPYCANGYPLEINWEALLLGNEINNPPSTETLKKKTLEAYIQIVKNSEITVREGFWDFVYELKEEKNFKIALITDYSKEIESHTINKTGVSELFDVTVYADGVKKPKPNPEIYKRALKALGIRAKQALVFEDSVPGVKSATDAGIDTLVIWDGITKKRLYKGRVLNMSLDFTTYVGSMDKTHLEYIAESCKGAVKDKKLVDY